MIKGIIFDIDGVIIDSEKLHAESLLQAIGEATGQSIEIKAADLIGLSLEATLAALAIDPRHATTVQRRSVELYLAKVCPQLVRPLVRETVSALEKNQIPFGFASTAEMRVCRANLDQVSQNLGHKPVIARESVAECKPYPEAYLKMLEVLNLEPSEAIVIEDSDIGITAAIAAGIGRVYAWPHGLSSSQSYRAAHKTINSLTDVEFIQSLFNQ